MASLMFSRASPRVAPWEWQPGKEGQDTAHPSSDSKRVTAQFILHKHAPTGPAMPLKSKRKRKPTGSEKLVGEGPRGILRGDLARRMIVRLPKSYTVFGQFVQEPLQTLDTQVDSSLPPPGKRLTHASLKTPRRKDSERGEFQYLSPFASSHLCVRTLQLPPERNSRPLRSRR